MEIPGPILKLDFEFLLGLCAQDVTYPDYKHPRMTEIHFSDRRHRF